MEENVHEYIVSSDEEDGESAEVNGLFERRKLSYSLVLTNIYCPQL